MKEPNMKKPIIGISLDWETKPTFSMFPWYALRQNYTTCFIDKGAITLPLPHDLKAVEDYLNIVDGVVVTGGAFDVDPRLYGEDLTEKVKDRLKPARTNFEMTLLKGALERNKPILGICGGEQVLNVVLGGSLIQHIPDEIAEAHEHLQAHDPHEVDHLVHVKEESLLHKITGKLEFMVNTSHHQAVKKIGKDMIVSAIAPDGVVEAIEYTQHPFCLGLQWHPEFLCSQEDEKIIQAFVRACTL